MTLEARILSLLAESASNGTALQAALSVDLSAFKAAARNLWVDGLIQGQLADGCCSAPCGTMCVSAMKLERSWQLSKKGRLRLKVMAAKGELQG
jgi:hypothetical protein